MLQSIEYSILLPALVTGLLVLATHVPLGQVVLQRGIIFIDLAIAQIAGLGVILAHLLFQSPQSWQIQLVAVSCAMAGAMILRYSEKKWLDIQEALIGVVFVLSASCAVLLLADNPHGSEQLKDLLSGQILWVDYQQLVYVAGLYTVILFIWFRFSQYRSGSMFYILFALAITASVQLVGVYLVFSSLIIPALATYKIRNQQYKLIYGYLSGILGYVAGLILSYSVDLPSGPLIVLTLAVSAVIFSTLLRQK